MYFIRKATTKDIDAILRLYTEQFQIMADLQPFFFQNGEQDRAFILKTITESASDIFVCQNEDSISGFALVREDKTPNFSFFKQYKFAFLMDIIVSEKHRSKSYGQALLQTAKQWASDRNCTYLQLDVLSNNDRAKQFYRKNGFIEIRNSLFCKL